MELSSKILPYVYKLTNRDTGEFYFGSRYSKKLTKVPEIDIFEYKSSSDVVKPIFDQFDVEIIALCFDPEFAHRTEHDFILAHWGDSLMLNRAAVYTTSTKFIKNSHSKGMSAYKFPDGSIKRVNTKDPRVLSGELISIFKGTKTGPCTTDRATNISIARSNTARVLCEFCYRKVDPGNFKQYHGENCKKNPDIDKSALETRSVSAKEHFITIRTKTGKDLSPKTPKGSFQCPYCNTSGTNYGNMHKYHFSNCGVKLSCTVCRKETIPGSFKRYHSSCSARPIFSDILPRSEIQCSPKGS